jgi:hypothetical protein
MARARSGPGASPAFAFIAIALSAAAVRLLPLQFLHPLNWDEIEFYRATSWIGEGRVPYRDFWEHHTPLAWFLFAPFTWLTNSPGADAILLMRWAQIPVWLATFFCLNLWMRGAGIERSARWAAMALALCSSLFMLPAVEYRVESVGCMLFVLGLLLAQRGRGFAAGSVFCLAGFANLRLGPVLVVTVLMHLARSSGLRTAAGSGRGRSRLAIVAGGVAALVACLAYFAVTGSLDELWQQVWRDNLGERYATPVIGGFMHRLLVPFGVRILATDRFFEWAAVDVGGVAVLALGFVGLVFAWPNRSLRGLAILQLANLLFIAWMKFIYNYHFALVVILAIPLIASVLERVRRREVVLALLLAAWGVNAFASIFRGKEDDLAYQDRIMREVHARTRPGEKVWSGVPWALRREPAYRFWFMPELARQLVTQNLGPRYSFADPPAAVVFDHYTLVWIATVQRDLAPYLVRHYVPVWRNLWIPGMNAVVGPGERVEWIVPRDGTYRVYASPQLARHPWFRNPLGAFKGTELSLRSMPHPPIAISAGPRLRKGERVAITSHATEPLGIIMIASDDRVLFRQPPDGASLEAETTRVTHVPRL